MPEPDRSEATDARHPLENNGPSSPGSMDGKIRGRARLDTPSLGPGSRGALSFCNDHGACLQETAVPAPPDLV